MGANPIMSKRSQQTSSEPEGDHQQVVSEAGCSEFAGRVLSPEISRVVVREDNPECQGKADSVHWLEGSSLMHYMASVCDTTGI